VFVDQHPEKYDRSVMSMPGGGDPQIWSGGDTNIDISQSFCLLYAFVYMIL